jgi:hypothetical protein
MRLVKGILVSALALLAVIGPLVGDVVASRHEGGQGGPQAWMGVPMDGGRPWIARKAESGSGLLVVPASHCHPSVGWLSSWAVPADGAVRPASPSLLTLHCQLTV